MKMVEEIIKKVQAFKYLGTHVSDDGDLDVEISHRIQCGWNAWRKLLGVLCDNKMNVLKKKTKMKKALAQALLFGCTVIYAKQTSTGCSIDCQKTDMAFIEIPKTTLQRFDKKWIGQNQSKSEEFCIMRYHIFSTHKQKFLAIKHFISRANLILLEA